MAPPWVAKSVALDIRRTLRNAIQFRAALPLAVLLVPVEQFARRHPKGDAKPL
jgi:hypothetical protein